MVATTKRPKRRWWVYLLAGLGVVVIGGVALIALGVSYGKSLVRTYTVTEPVALPEVVASEAHMTQLKRRWVEFVEAVQTRQPVAPFRLTAEDLNQFLAHIPDLHNRLHLTIENDTLAGRFSIPMDPGGRNGFMRGRHLNGHVQFKLSFVDNWLALNLAHADAHGKALPGWLLNRIRSKNLLEHLERDKNLQETLDAIETIEVKDGAVVLTPYELGR
jgi:hypothetical protein